jgi:hypothetical protein
LDYPSLAAFKDHVDFEVLVHPWIDRNVAAAEQKEARARTIEENWGVYVDRALQRSGIRPPQISKHLVDKLATLSTLCHIDIAIPMLVERIRVRIGERHTSKNTYLLPNDVERVIEQWRAQAASTPMVQELICSHVDGAPRLSPQPHLSPSPLQKETPAPPSPSPVSSTISPSSAPTDTCCKESEPRAQNSLVPSPVRRSGPCGCIVAEPSLVTYPAGFVGVICCLTIISHGNDMSFPLGIVDWFGLAARL